MTALKMKKTPLPLNSDKREYKNSVARGGRQRKTTSTHLHFPSLQRHVRDDNAIMYLPQGRELIIIIIINVVIITRKLHRTALWMYRFPCILHSPFPTLSPPL